MLKPYNFRINYGKLQKDAAYRICSVQNPNISWSVMTNEFFTQGDKAPFQKAFRIKVESDKVKLWDSGWQETSEQSVRYSGAELPLGQRIDFTVEIKDSADIENAVW